MRAEQRQYGSCGFLDRPARYINDWPAVSVAYITRIGQFFRDRYAIRIKTHQLNSAVVLVKDGKTLWRHVSIARMTMRDLDPGFVGRYLGRVGDVALSSVGAYQVEGPGIQLFDKIEGDYFTIVGLPLLPLLAELRKEKLIDG